MAQPRRLNGSDKTSISVGWPTKDKFDFIRIPVDRYDGMVGHHESDEDVIQRLFTLYEGLVKFKNSKTTPADIARLDGLLDEFVKPISKEPHSAFPWALKKKKK